MPPLKSFHNGISVKSRRLFADMVDRRRTMRVDDSQIQLHSSRKHVEKHDRKDELKVWTGRRPDERTEGPGRSRRPDSVSISDEARARFESMKKRFDETRAAREFDIPGGLDHEGFLKKLLLEAFLGKKIEVTEVEQAGAEASVEQCRESARQAEDWGMEYNSTEFTASFEEITFSASGTVRTADGAEVEFTLELSMQRASITETTTSLKAGNAIDPLVINFGGKAAELTSTRFAFDIDSDGENENIPFAGPGSGFLVFDRNGDKKANNGQELFGPSSGNGFSELSELDQDGNSWIDESDGAWNNLFVWTKALDGSDIMRSLSEAGVGAIHVAYSETSFELRAASGALDGQLRRSGVYLGEDMTPGLIQQIDLAV